MSNMSYCRFRNTLSDLQDCYEHMSDEVESDENEEGLSEDEDEARKKLIELCKDIASDFESE